jgi:hypothetical protein
MNIKVNTYLGLAKALSLVSTSSVSNESSVLTLDGDEILNARK